MKSFLLFFVLLLPSFALAEEPLSLDLSQDHPLAHELARLLKKKELPTGTTINLKITDSQKTKPATRSTTPTQSRNLLAMLSYQGKKGAPSSISQAATRSGGKPAIKIVALSPSDEAITMKSQPRLWWHQSSASVGGELEFVLSELKGSTQKVVFRRPIPAMKKGFNVIDLGHRAVNPKVTKLNSGGTYQWTINHRDGTQLSPAYAKLRCKINDTLISALPQGGKLHENMSERELDAMQSLANSGNWHELLDLAATAAAHDPKQAELRTKLLKEADLTARITQ